MDMIINPGIIESNLHKPEADYSVGGGWGDLISWSDSNKFGETPEDGNYTYRLHGFKHLKPKVGQTLVGEFETVWSLFEFIDVEYCYDPADMFFANVWMYKQVDKNTGEEIVGPTYEQYKYSKLSWYQKLIFKFKNRKK